MTNSSNIDIKKSNPVINPDSDKQNVSVEVSYDKVNTTKLENISISTSNLSENPSVINQIFSSSQTERNENLSSDLSNVVTSTGVSNIATVPPLPSTTSNYNSLLTTEELFPILEKDEHFVGQENRLLQSSGATETFTTRPSIPYDTNDDEDDDFNGWTPLVMNPIHSPNYSTKNQHVALIENKYKPLFRDPIYTDKTERNDGHSNKVSSFSSAFLTKINRRDGSLHKLKYDTEKFSSLSSFDSIWNNFEASPNSKKRTSRKGKMNG